MGMQNPDTTPIRRSDTGERTRLRAAQPEGKDTNANRVGSLGAGAVAAALLGTGMGRHEGRQMSQQPAFVAA